MTRIESVSNDVQAMRIFDAPKLDPIFVVLHDTGPGTGRLLVECYSTAWATYWGGMGDLRLREFITCCDPDYLANRLFPAKQRRTKADYDYLTRIVHAVQAALRVQS